MPAHDGGPARGRLDVHVDDDVAVVRGKEIGEIGHRRLSYGPCPSDLSMLTWISSSSNTVCWSGWRTDDVFAESVRRREGADEWVFYEGPPTANGRPGIHHVWARLFKDIYPRFHTMRGRHVPRKAGWDCHGLPVEVEVEKELGFAGKPEIEEFGIEAFNQRCRESVQRYVEDWSALTGPHRHVARHVRRVLDDEQLLHRERVVAVPPDVGRAAALRGPQGRAVLRSVRHRALEPRARPTRRVPRHHRGLGVRPVPGRGPRLRPARVDDDTVDARLQRRGGRRPRHRVRTGAVSRRQAQRDLVMARTRVKAVLGDDAEIVGPVPVDELVGHHYERPFDWLEPDGDAWRVVAAEFVTTEDGSGIVHLAPAFGEIDREVADAEQLPMINPVNGAARFTDAVPGLAGTFVKDADAELIDDPARRTAGSSWSSRTSTRTHTAGAAGRR